MTGGAGESGLGSELRACRLAAGLSQELLAERASLSVRAVRKLEAGQVRRPHRRTLDALTEVLAATEEERHRLYRLAGAPYGAGELTPRTVPAELPMDVTTFVGRERQLDDLRRVAAEDSVGAGRVAIVTGPAGIGKTATAVHAAHLIRHAFPDGQLYVQLGGGALESRAVAEVLYDLLLGLGASASSIPLGSDRRAALYRSLLADRKVLLILDAATDVSALQQLIATGPGCATVVTSRSRLAGVDGAVVVDLALPSVAEALEMLSVSSGRQLTADEVEAAREVVDACGLLPLAVRIAGARLAGRPHWSLADLARSLRDSPSRLRRLAFGGMSVEATFDVSYRGLHADAARALRLLGLADLPDFVDWMAAALLDQDLDDAVEVVEQLVDARLVEVSGRDRIGQLRYRVHELVRLYAAERGLRTVEPSQRRASLHRLLLGWLELATTADRLIPVGSLGGRPSLEVPHRFDAAWKAARLARPLDWFEVERAALGLVVARAATQTVPGIPWDLAACLAAFFEARHHHADWRRTHEVALDAARRQGDRQGQGRMLLGLGELAVNEQRFREARELLEEAGRLFALTGDEHGVGHVSHDLGVLAHGEGRVDAAAEHGERAYELFQRAGDLRMTGHAAFGLSVARRDQGRMSEATSLLDEAVTSFSETGTRHSQAHALVHRGRLALRRDDLPQARADLTGALMMCRRFDDEVGQTRALRGLAELALAAGSLDSADELVGEALRLARAVDSPMDEAVALEVVADLARRRDRPAVAREALLEGARLWAALGLAAREASARSALAALDDQLGHAGTGRGSPPTT